MLKQSQVELVVFKQVATDHGMRHRILKAAMYNRLEELKEIIISEPRAVQEKEVRMLSTPLVCLCAFKSLLAA